MYFRLITVLTIAAFFTNACVKKTGSTDLNKRSSSEADSIHTSFYLPVYTADKVEIISQNSESFDAKLRLIDNATKTLDLAYFLYIPDFTTSTLTQRLIQKAKDGVKVRLLVSANFAMSDRNYFRAMMAEGKGNLQVAYFRPIPTRFYDKIRSWGFEDPADFLELLLRNDKAVIARKAYLALSNKAIRQDALRLISILNPVAAANAFLNELGEAIGREDFKKDPGGAYANLLRQVTSRLGVTEDLAHWADLSKSIHHKLLVSDGKVIQGGGRNIADHYHLDEGDPLFSKGADHTLYWDVDFVVHSEGIGAEALKTFNAYWECRENPWCPAGIVVSSETLKPGQSYNEEYKRITQEAMEYKATRRLRPTQVETIPTITAHNVKVGYAENRMFPGSPDRAKNLIFREEESQYNELWCKLIDSVPAGQQVTFNNFFTYLTPNLTKSVVSAIRRGVKFTFVSNSANDPGGQYYLPSLAQLQYRALLREGAKQNNSVEILEMTTRARLHSKSNSIGDHFLVGSTNADPRSEFLDSQNGVWIQPGGNVTGGGRTFKNVSLAFEELFREHLNRLSKTTTVFDNKTYPSLVKLNGKTIMAQIIERMQNGSRFQTFQKIVNYLEPVSAKSMEPTQEGEKARHLINDLFLQF